MFIAPFGQAVGQFFCTIPSSSDGTDWQGDQEASGQCARELKYWHTDATVWSMRGRDPASARKDRRGAARMTAGGRR